MASPLLTLCCRSRIMLKIQRASNEGIVFTLIGRIEMEHVAELRRLLSLEKAGHRIALDLREVTLVERDAVKFLAECEADSILLVNCPPYIREWINRDQKRKSDGTQEHQNEPR
jgi:anti-anti-sigma regulatory factor